MYNNGVFTPIVYSGASDTYADAINDNGVVVVSTFYNNAGISGGSPTYLYANGMFSMNSPRLPARVQLR